MKRYVAITILMALATAAGAAPNFQIFKDINDIPRGTLIEEMEKAGEKVFMAVDPLNADNELWVSDGTPDGTTMVRSYANSIRGLYPYGNEILIHLNATDDPFAVSDGALAGTDFISPGNGNFEFMGVLGDQIILFDEDASQIIATDGSTISTIDTLTSASNKSFMGKPEDAHVSANGLYYLRYAVPFKLVQLMRIEPDLSLTMMDFHAFDGNPPNRNLEITSIGDLVYYASPGGSGTDENIELYAYNKTADETSRVKDINPGDPGSNPEYFTEAGGNLFFAAYNEMHGKELWISDGTDAGTQRISEIAPGASSASFRNLATWNGQNRYLVSAGSRIYFAAHSQVSVHAEPWTSDGENTFRLKDIAPGDENGSGVSDIVSFDGKAVFAADSSDKAKALWMTDGTTQGTQVVLDYDVNEGPDKLKVFDGVLWMATFSETAGQEPHTLASLNDSPALIADITPGTNASNPRDFVKTPTQLFFTAVHSRYGRELWVSDGTPDGTRMVRDLYPGVESGVPRAVAPPGVDFIAPWRGSVVFYGKDQSGPAGIWRSDGTSDGTEKLYPTGAPGEPELELNDQSFYMAIYQGDLCFPAVDMEFGNPGIWKIDWDGSLELLTDRTSDSDFFDAIFNLAPTADYLFFRARISGNTWFYRTNGEIPETLQLPRDIDTLNALEMVAYKGRLFACASDLDNAPNKHLFITNSAATDWNVVGIEDRCQIVATNNYVYYGSNGELKALGDPDGSPFAIVDKSADGSVDSSPGAQAGSLFFYSADRSSKGEELFKTSSGSGLASLVEDINPAGDSNPNYYIGGPQHVYFTARKDGFGREWFRSDGTETGTFMLRDLNPGESWGAGREGINFLNNAYMVAGDGALGWEIYVYAESADPRAAINRKTWGRYK